MIADPVFACSFCLLILLSLFPGISAPRSGKAVPLGCAISFFCISTGREFAIWCWALLAYICWRTQREVGRLVGHSGSRRTPGLARILSLTVSANIFASDLLYVILSRVAGAACRVGWHKSPALVLPGNISGVIPIAIYRASYFLIAIIQTYVFTLSAGRFILELRRRTNTNPASCLDSPFSVSPDA